MNHDNDSITMGRKKPSPYKECVGLGSFPISRAFLYSYRENKVSFSIEKKTIKNNALEF